MEFHQVLVSASPGDAITNVAFEIRALLRRVGPSEIYARYIDASLAHEVVPLQKYARRPTGDPATDVILFHASIGEPDVLSFVLERPERLVLLYHNISPPEPFREYDPAFAGLLEAGRFELAELAPRTSLALADSTYNAAELEDLGYRDVRVTPLILDLSRLREGRADPLTANHLAEQVHGPVVLFVGQVLPHKRPDLLVKAYHVLVTYLVPEAHLIMVGAGRLPAYRAAVQLLIQELNLPNAWLVGSVTDAQMAAFYRRADVFVTASEHEGFGVPIIEAMALDKPIVARAHAAIPETVGGAGLVLPPDDDPVLLAEGVAEILGNDTLRAGFTAAGRRRVADFDPTRARATFLGHLLEIA